MQLTVQQLVRLLHAEIKMLQSGSCGDGSFDYKMSQIETKECENALRVIEKITGIK